MKIKDKTGMRFGTCTVVGFNSMRKTETDSRAVWNMLCDCGATFTNYRLSDLKRCRSCNNEHIANLKFKHGESTNRTGAYTSWGAMLKRCNDKNCKSYEKYGGAGIIVCAEWDLTKGGSYLNFLEDMGQRPKGTTLNRINGAKVYSKATCEWATYSVQSRDQRLRQSNKSGMRGVRVKTSKSGTIKYEVSLFCKPKLHHIGTFESFDDAKAARVAAEIKYYGEFYEL